MCAQTGELWQKQGEHEMAEGCFAAAMQHAGPLAEAARAPGVPDARRQALVDAMFGLYAHRAQAAWALQQEVRAASRILPGCRCLWQAARQTMLN